MFAGQHRLGNLTTIVDYNRIQCTSQTEDILDLSELPGKINPFGWDSWNVYGHYNDHLQVALSYQINKPTCVITHTTKGKGVSFMEGAVEWHFKSPSDEELEKVLEELR
jgi:transketolase